MHNKHKYVHSYSPRESLCTVSASVGQRRMRTAVSGCVLLRKVAIEAVNVRPLKTICPDLSREKAERYM